MKITKLILRNCDRFLLNQIKEIVYTPQSPYQLITGNNGSGKSSLLEELSPLPPDKNKFTTNGYKEIHIVHDGKQYLLVNDFTKGGSGQHSFKLNGEELNDGQNVSTQLQLVKEHFRYTKEIHELVIGKKRFTSMSGLQRRDWFVKISNVDMTYIMNLFNNVKTAFRDNQGAIKLQTKRLASSLEQLLPKEEEQALQKETDEYQLIIDKLVSLIPREIENVEVYESNLQQVTNDAKWMMEELKTHPEPNRNNAKSFEDYRLLVEAQITKTQFLKQQFQEAKQKHLELEEKYSKINWDENISEEEIKKELSEIDSTLQTLGTPINFTGDINQAIEEALKIKQPFEEWCALAPTNTDGRFNPDNVSTMRSRFEACDIRLRSIKEGITRLEAHIDHIKSNRFETHCPSCQFRFQTSPGSDKLPQFEEKLQKGYTTLPEVEKEHREFLAFLTEYRQYEDAFLYCKRTFVLPHPLLSGFFDKLLGLNFRDTPLVAIGQIDKYIKVLKDTQTFNTLTERKRFLEALLSTLYSGEGTFLKTLLLESDTKLSSLQGEITQLTQKQEQLKDQYRQTKRYFDILTALDEKFEEYEKIQDNIELAIEKSFLEESLTVFKKTFYTLSERLSEMKTKRKVVEDIDRYLDELKTREAEFKVLLDILNPNDGLIAKTLLGFIRHFLDQFNQLIGHIWTYDMKVVAEESSEFTKNYNFPLKQANKATPSQDVRESSKGQQEMVDFAFLLLTMRYLGLSHFPLLLDELGGGFTEVHRIHIFNYLKQLVETGQVEQLFLISHNATSHDTLNLADVICFDPQGIMTDERTNKVIQFN